MIMSPTSDTSSCFYGDQGANPVALLRTVLLRADQRVERGVRRCFSVFMRGSKNLPVALLQVVSFFFAFHSGMAASQALAPVKNYQSSTFRASHQTSALTDSSLSFLTL